MDKLKNLLKSDTPTSDNPAVTSSSSTGRLAGQGSHFPGKEEQTLGSTATGTDPSTRGPTDVSAAAAEPTAAATTAGPEQGGSGHVNTASTYTQPSTQREIQDYSVSSADFPKTETAPDGSGTAAIGQTGTYTSTSLAQGNPTSSVVDPESSDPLTYKKPEAGVGAGAAATAAGLAFNAGEERKKSELAGSQNPYLASSLDPRVDGMSKASAEAATSSAAPTTSSSTAATGLASAGAASAYNSSSTQREIPAPSALTTTADPADRSAEYSASTDVKGLGTTSAEPATSTTTEPAENRQSVVGRVLGAVGLGSVAGALGAGSLTSKDDTAVAETPEQPTTTTGLTDYTAPTQQGPPTSHHRKESIPTTAYPSGTFDSPRAINQPIGGAGSPVVHGDQDQGSRTGSNVATGVVAGGTAVGAAAIGAHEYDNSKSLRENISSEPHGSAPVLKEAGDTTATTGVEPSKYSDAQALRTNISEDTSSGVASAHHATTVGEGESTLAPSATAYSTEKAVEQPYTAPATTSATTSTTAPVVEEEKDHTARDAAIGVGAGAAAAGAGAYGAHEYSKKEAERAETEAAKERAAHEKELAKQKAAQEKELEKQHKAEEKAAAKEEKQHQKEIEKEEKKHQKELEKEEKEREKEAKHQAELAAVRDRREKEKEQALLEKQREEEAFDRRNSAQRESLVGATETEGKKEEKEKEKEKKPSFFRRIFKRRKNKDTGESEDYSSAEEDDSHKAAYGAAIVGAGAGAGAVGAKAAEEDKAHYTAVDPQNPQNQEAKDQYAAHLMGVGGTTATMKDDEFKGQAASHPTEGTTYEELSGGAQKPSYNPFSKDDKAIVTGAPDESGPTTAIGSTGSATEPITGLPYDASKDPAAAQRLSQHTHGTDIGTFDSGDAAVAAGEYERGVISEKSTAPTTLDSTGTQTMQPTEAVTGTTAATGTTGQIAPGTVESTGTTSQQPTGAVIGLPYREKAVAPDTTSSTSGVNTDFTLGEIEKKDPLHHTAAGEGTSGQLPINTDFTLGQIVDPKEEKKAEEGHSSGFGQKIKDTFHMGGLEP